jgi:hypothetical protein
MNRTERNDQRPPTMNGGQQPNGYTVLPLVRYDGEMTEEVALRMLAFGDGVVLSWCSLESPVASARSWGMAIDKAGPLARGFGRIAQAIPLSSGNAETLFRAIPPAGQTIENLVPAIGGGFRGMTRIAESGTKIAGQARFAPVAVGGAGLAGGIALGPFVALIAVSVAGEMIAQHQMNKRLDAINAGIRRIEQKLDYQDEATLNAAEGKIREVSHALLDQLVIPDGLGAGATFANLQRLRAETTLRLKRWDSVVAKHEGRTKGNVDAPKLLDELSPGKLSGFATTCRRMYLSLALDARIVLLNKVEADLNNPQVSIANFERSVAARLLDLSQQQRQLRDIVGRIGALELSGKFSLKESSNQLTVDFRSLVGRIALGLGQEVDALPVLDGRQQPVLELAQAADGELRVLQPAVR